MYAVAVGEMFDRMNFHGPFADFEDAEMWAEQQTETASTWIVRLENTGNEARLIEFNEIDGGPSGVWWEADCWGDYRSFTTEDEMYAAAVEYKRQGFAIKFNTQAEYQLTSALEDLG
jgi:hypothetical protein